MHWQEIEGWFQWRSAQEEAARYFRSGSCFVEVGTYLGRSLCSLAEVVEQSGKTFTVIGIDNCRGSGAEGPRQKDYHGDAVARGQGTFAGALHKNLLDCGFGDRIQLIISDSIAAARLFSEASLDWVHLDARQPHRGSKKRRQIPDAELVRRAGGVMAARLELPEVHGAVAAEQRNAAPE